MTTKNHGLSFKSTCGHQDLGTNGNPKYSNLNLNQRHNQNQSYVTPMQPRSAETRGIFNSGGNDNSKLNSKILGKQLTPSKFDKSYKRENHLKSGKPVKQVKDKDAKTLTLHITAFENSQKASGSVDTNLSAIKKPKSWKNLKQTLQKSHSKQSVFEIPRQQESKMSEPEIMQFKASQVLLNPNATPGEENKHLSLPAHSYVHPPLPPPAGAPAPQIRQPPPVGHPPVLQPGFALPQGFRMINENGNYRNQPQFQYIPPPPGFTSSGHNLQQNYVPPPPGYSGPNQYGCIPQPGYHHQQQYPPWCLPPGYQQPQQPQQQQQYAQFCVPPPYQQQHLASEQFSLQQQQHYQSYNMAQNYQFLQQQCNNGVPPPVVQQQLQTVVVQKLNTVYPQMTNVPLATNSVQSQQHQQNIKIQTNATTQNSAASCMASTVHQCQPTSPLTSTTTQTGAKSRQINWEEPEVAKLIMDKVNDLPEAMSYQKIAEAVTVILKRKVVRSTVEGRVDSLRKGKSRRKIKEDKKMHKWQQARKKGIIIIEDAVRKLNELAQNYKIVPINNAFASPVSPKMATTSLQYVSHDISFDQPLSSVRAPSPFPFTSAAKTMFYALPTTTPPSVTPPHQNSNPPSPTSFTSPIKVDFDTALPKTASPTNSKLGPSLYIKAKAAPRLIDGLTNRLTPCLLLEEGDFTFQYVYQKTVNGRQYYLCSTCRAVGPPCSSLILHDNGEAVTGAHHPLCNPLSNFASLCKQKERQGRLSAANGMAGDAAYLKTFQECKKKNVDIHLKPYAFHRKQLCRWARRNYAPSALGYINEQFHGLYADDTSWLDYDDGEIAIFATDRSYTALAKCRIAAGDATFSTSPTGVEQTFVLHGFVENKKGGEWVPLLMALMKSKDEKSYLKITDHIKSSWERLNLKPEIERLHLDYETAEGNAFKNLLGEDKIFGCLFHYSQIIIRRLTKPLYQAYCMVKGNAPAPYYRTIRTWIRAILALPLLPREHANFLWKSLLHLIPRRPENVPEADWPEKDLLELSDYVTKNWIEREDNMWEFFGCGRTKNTNICEAYHSVMSKRYKHKPTLGEFLSKQQVEFTMHDTRLRQLELNYEVKPRDVKYEILQDQLEYYEAVYLRAFAAATDDAEKIAAMYTFIRKASYLLHDVRNKSGKTMKSQKRQLVTDLRNKANDSFVWKADLNFSLIGPSFNVIDAIEKSLIDAGDDDENVEIANDPFLEDIVPVILDDSILAGNNESIIHDDDDAAALKDAEIDTIVLGLDDDDEDDDEHDPTPFIYTPGTDMPEQAHLRRLREDDWLDDVIINEYLKNWIGNDSRFLLVDSIAWRPDYVVKSWGPERRNKRLPTVPAYSDVWEYAIFPINLNGRHWTLAILQKSSLTITYFDTLHGFLPAPQLKLLFIYSTLLTGQKCFFQPAALHSYMKQTDGYNCGVLICMIAQNYFLGEPLFFSKKDIKKWRDTVAQWLQEKYFGKTPIVKNVP